MPAPCGHISVGTADTFESLVEKQSGRRDVVGEGHFTRLQSLPQAIVHMPRQAKNRSVQKMYFWCPLVAVVFFFQNPIFLRPALLPAFHMRTPIEHDVRQSSIREPRQRYSATWRRCAKQLSRQHVLKHH